MAAGLGGPGVQDRGVDGRIMAEQQFCLRWNNFQSNIVSSFENLLDKEEFVDVTLSAEGKSLKAHKVLLSACSPYFRDLFRDLPQYQHPVIVLRDTGFSELKSLLSFIYHGEVNVSQDRLGLLLKTAESLRIKGLAQDKRANSLEQFGTVTTSPTKEGDENFEHIEREHRVISPNSPALHMGLSTLPNSNLPPGNLLVPLEPPSHKSPILHQSPPAKKRKTPHSPHSRTSGPITPGHTPPGHPHSGPMPPGPTPPGPTPPGHTPPGHTPPSSGGPPSITSIRDINCSRIQSTPPHNMHPFQQTTPTSSSSSSSLPTSEEESKVVNLTVGGNGAISTPQSPPRGVLPKLEIVGEEENINLPMMGIVRERDRDVVGPDSDQEMSEELHSSHHDEDSRDNGSESNSTSQDMIHLSSRLGPVQTFVPYHGSSQMDNYPGPSGVIATASQAAASWRNSTAHTKPPEGEGGGHPVFNELFGDGSGCGGKKAVPTPCPVCSKVLSNAYNMRVHLETHQDITYKCIICGIITRTRDTMRKHLSNVHKLRNVELKNSFKKITGKSGGNGNPVTSPKVKIPKSSPNVTPVAISDWSSSPKTEMNWAVPILPKNEPKWTVPSTTSSESIDFKQGTLASIVSKLTQKQ